MRKEIDSFLNLKPQKSTRLLKVYSLNRIGKGNFEVSLSLQNIQTFNLTETVKPNGQTNSLQDTQVIGGT